MLTLIRTIIVTMTWWMSPLAQWASIQREWWMTSAAVHPYRTRSHDMVLELRRQRTRDDAGFGNPPVQTRSAASRLNA